MEIDDKTPELESHAQSIKPWRFFIATRTMLITQSVPPNCTVEDNACRILIAFSAATALEFQAHKMNVNSFTLIFFTRNTIAIMFKHT